MPLDYIFASCGITVLDAALRMRHGVAGASQEEEEPSRSRKTG